MAINETQLTTWSSVGSVQQSAATYQTIRSVLDHKDSAYYPKLYQIFLQGSYGNDTNVWRDSDVDVVMRLTSVYYPDTSSLTPPRRRILIGLVCRPIIRGPCSSRRSLLG